MSATSKILKILAFFCLTILPFTGVFAQVEDPEEDPNVTESGKPRDTIPRDDIYDRYMTAEKLTLAYDHLHEKDVMWEKRIWRLIDTREKRNHHFAYEKKPFIRILLDAAKKGDIQAFSVIDDEFTTALTQEEMQQLGSSVDTVITFDPETFQEIVTVVVNELNPNDVKQYRLKEVYFFDEERSDLGVRILGIAPIVNRYDDNGNFLNSGPMFWTYYPDMRRILAKTPYFNESNDVNHMSWEDVFEARIFSSYIIKESNVYDRRIQDYKSGIDVLYESDKIKDGIFHFEHDLWDY
jgi:gliding motility associated protien GldN